MKLLLVTDAVGGVWTYSLELGRALLDHGIEAVLAVVGPPPSARQRRDAGTLPLIDTGLPLDWLDTSPAEQRWAGDALAALASREGVDVVQTCSAAVLAQTRFAQPAVAVQHSCIASWWAAVRGTELPSDFAWRRELTARGLRAASAVVAPSKAFAAETRRLYDPGGPVLAVPNGRSARSRKAPAAAPADLVVTAGRLWDDGKNVSTLDCAAARLSIRFEAVGPLEGPNGARGHFANLHCGGELAEAQLAELLSTRPIFASAALYEPFGLAVLEAAQAGCALILSDIPTFRELWGEAACFVEARDGDGFATAIQHLLDNPEERARLGEAAQVRSRRYTPAAMAGSMAQLYAQLLARPSLELAGAA